MEGILKTEPEDSQDIINFQSYIDAVKKEQIKWDLFVQLMLDLSNTSMNRQKLLISILLNEFKNYMDKDNNHSQTQEENKIEKENDKNFELGKSFQKVSTMKNFKQQSNESLIREDTAGQNIKKKVQAKNL